MLSKINVLEEFNMKLLKILAVIMAVCLLGSAFIACDSGDKTEDTTEATVTVAIKVNLIIKEGSTTKYQGETSCNGTLGDAIEMFCAGEFEEEITCFDSNGILKTIGEVGGAETTNVKGTYKSVIG